MTDSDSAPHAQNRSSFMRLYGSPPWLKTSEKKHVRGRIFKSGNSLAFRIPAGTRLTAGMEMDLTIEDGQYLSLEPIERPKRKFNIAKVAGSARNLEPIEDDDRVFRDRPLIWDRVGKAVTDE